MKRKTLSSPTTENNEPESPHGKENMYAAQKTSASKNNLSEKQEKYLEKYFTETDTAPSYEQRIILSAQTSLCEDKIKLWFSNRRRRHRRTLSRKAKPKISDPDFQARVVDAITKNDVSLVKSLLFLDPSHPKINNHPLDLDGHTAVHWAAALGKPDVLRMLHSMGDSFLVTNHSGETPLHRAVIWPHCMHARTFPEVLLLLRENCNTASNEGYIPLHDIAFLLKDADKSQMAEYYMTELCKKVCDSTLHVQLNYQDFDGDTAFGTCAEAGNRKCVVALLEAGCDPFLTNSQGESPIDYCNDEIKFIIQAYSKKKPSPLSSSKSVTFADDFQHNSTSPPPHSTSTSPPPSSPPPSSSPFHPFTLPPTVSPHHPKSSPSPHQKSSSSPHQKSSSSPHQKSSPSPHQKSSHSAQNLDQEELISQNSSPENHRQDTLSKKQSSFSKQLHLLKDDMENCLTHVQNVFKVMDALIDEISQGSRKESASHQTPIENTPQDGPKPHDPSSEMDFKTLKTENQILSDEIIRKNKYIEILQIRLANLSKSNH